MGCRGLSRAGLPKRWLAGRCDAGLGVAGDWVAGSPGHWVARALCCRPVLSGNEQADLHGPTVPRSSGGSPPCGRDRIQLAFGTARSAREATPTMLRASRTESIGPSPTATTNKRRPLHHEHPRLSHDRPPPHAAIVPPLVDRLRRQEADASDARREPAPLDHPRTRRRGTARPPLRCTANSSARQRAPSGQSRWARSRRPPVRRTAPGGAPRPNAMLP